MINFISRYPWNYIMLWICCYSVKYKQYITNEMNLMLINGLNYGLYTPTDSHCHFVQSNMYSDKSTFSWSEKPKQFRMNGTRYQWWSRNKNFIGTLPCSLPLPFPFLLPSFPSFLALLLFLPSPFLPILSPSHSLRSKLSFPPLFAARRYGERLSSPSGFAKCLLVLFQRKILRYRLLETKQTESEVSLHHIDHSLWL